MCKKEIDALSHQYAINEAKESCGFTCDKCGCLPIDCAHYDAFYSYWQAVMENNNPEENKKPSDKILKQNTFGYVYFINKRNTNEYKIGVTRNIRNRIINIKSSSGSEIDLICHIKNGDFLNIEKELHKKYDANRKLGEWFVFDTVEVLLVIEEIKSYNIDAIRG